MYWKKQSDFSFAFYNEDASIGQMTIDYTSKNRLADCQFYDKRFQIRHTGFWKTGVEIANSENEIVLTAQPNGTATAWKFCTMGDPILLPATAG